MELSLIYGSDREGRFCDTVAQWCLGELRTRGDIKGRVIDPKVLDLDVPTHREAASRDIQQSDAVLILVPEYNHSFPAALKTVIDAFHGEWQLKPVSFVSYGGHAGGIRAVEQLRLVFIELHAIPVNAAMSLANPWDHFDSRGRPGDLPAQRRRLNRVLDQLSWWAAAMGQARAAHTPYRRVA